MNELDLAFFRAINGGPHPAALDWLARALQSPWWLWAPLAAAAVWLVWKGGRQGRWCVLTAVIAVVVTDVLCAQVLKPLIARPRPTAVLADVVALVGRKSSWSMPSNHAANVAAAAFVIAYFYRRWLIPAVAIALLVGWSRVYVGVHYPGDVLAGYLVGASLAAAAVFASLRYRVRGPESRLNPPDIP